MNVFLKIGISFIKVYIMSNKVFERYIRQIIVDKVGVEGQRKFIEARVLVVGAGGLGSAVLQQLAAAGIGAITIIDPDIVELHNLNRQCIHNENTIGRPKVDSAKEYMQNFNSEITIHTIADRFDLSNAQALMQDADIVVDCTDNFATRYILNDVCADLGKPLVYGSILSFEGQVAVFNHKGKGNLRDIFPVEPASNIDCDALGVLGPLPGVIGNIMAMEVLKIVLDLETLQGKYLVLDALTWQTTILKYS